MAYNYSARDIFEKARRNGYAIGAFNACNTETIKAIVQAAVKLKSPVIIESSSGETNYIGAKNLADIISNYREEFRIPILVNLDHAHDEGSINEGIAAGYDLIHVDASEMEYGKNILFTSKIVALAHSKSLLVEGEIDYIQGSSEQHKEKVEVFQSKGKYTDPDQAVEFVKQTKVDTLASFIGNVHGVYQNAPKLDLNRLRQIAGKVDCFLSLHGGSGIPEDQVKGAIEAGIVKVNVNTEMRMAFKTALLKSLQGSDELAIYKLTPPAIETVQKVVEEKIKLFGSAGKV